MNGNLGRMTKDPQANNSLMGCKFETKDICQPGQIFRVCLRENRLSDNVSNIKDVTCFAVVGTV